MNKHKVKHHRNSDTETANRYHRVPVHRSSIAFLLLLQIVKILRFCEHMVNRVSSFFSKGGHSETETKLKITRNTR